MKEIVSGEVHVGLADDAMTYEGELLAVVLRVVDKKTLKCRELLVDLVSLAAALNASRLASTLVDSIGVKLSIAGDLLAARSCDRCAVNGAAQRDTLEIFLCFFNFNNSLPHTLSIVLKKMSIPSLLKLLKLLNILFAHSTFARVEFLREVNISVSNMSSNTHALHSVLWLGDCVVAILQQNSLAINDRAGNKVPGPCSSAHSRPVVIAGSHPY